MRKRKEAIWEAVRSQGESPARPGEYRERGPRGGEVKNPRQVTMEKGDKPLPPTSEQGNTWERTGSAQAVSGTRTGDGLVEPEDEADNPGD